MHMWLQLNSNPSRNTSQQAFIQAKAYGVAARMPPPSVTIQLPLLSVFPAANGILFKR